MAWPMVASGALSALPSLIEKFWPGKNSKEKYEQIPNMSGGQNDLLSQLMSGLGGGDTGGGPMGQGMDWLSKILGGDTESFEKPMMRDFNENIIPGMKEQFSSAGAGSQGSSAFGQQMGAQGAGLMERLGAMRGGLQQGAMGQLSGLMGQGLAAQPFSTRVVPGKGGFGASMAQPMGQMSGMLGQYGLQQHGQAGQMNMLTEFMKNIKGG